MPEPGTPPAMRVTIKRKVLRQVYRSPDPWTALERILPHAAELLTGDRTGEVVAIGDPLGPRRHEGSDIVIALPGYRLSEPPRIGRNRAQRRQLQHRR